MILASAVLSQYIRVICTVVLQHILQQCHLNNIHCYYYYYYYYYYYDLLCQ